MKAINVELKKDVISFDIVHNDNAPFTNAEGRPVRQSIGGWLNSMPTAYTEENVEGFIEAEMYKVVKDIERSKVMVGALNTKVNKISQIQLAPEIVMISPAQVQITTVEDDYESPIKIVGVATEFDTLSYRVKGEHALAQLGEIEPQSPFTIAIPLDAGNYEIFVDAWNKRGTVTDSIRITIIPAEENDKS